MSKKLIFIGLMFLSTPSFSSLQQFWGFESGETLDLKTSAGTFSITSSKHRGGVYGLDVTTTTTGTGSVAIGKFDPNATQSFSFNDSTIFIGFYWRFDRQVAFSIDEYEPMFTLQDTASGTKFKLNLRATDNDVYALMATDSGGSIIDVGSTAITPGTTYFIEATIGTNVDVDTPNSATYSVKINGVADGSLGASAFNGTDSAGFIVLGKDANHSSRGVQYFYDDLTVSDTALVGSRFVTPMLPDSIGTYQTWTIGAGAGTHAQQVDEIPNDGDTTYLKSNLNVGDKETENFESTASRNIAGTITGVKFNVAAKKTGTTTQFDVIGRSNSTDFTCKSNANTNGNYRIYGCLDATNPNTSVAWTLGDLDGVELGVNDSDGADQTNFTNALITVLHTSTTSASASIPKSRFIPIVITE